MCVLDFQVVTFVFSAVVHSTVQSIWGTKTLNRFDIIPLAIMLLSKTQPISWMIHIVCTGIFATFQILTSKLPFLSEPSEETNANKDSRSEGLTSPPEKPTTSTWLSNIAIQKCIFENIFKKHKKHLTVADHPVPFYFIHFSTYTDGQQELNDLFSNLCERKKVLDTEICRRNFSGDPNQFKEPLLVFVLLGVRPSLQSKSSHWTLICIDTQHHEISYYDSFGDYGTYSEIMHTLQEMTNKMTSGDFPPCSIIYNDAPDNADSKPLALSTATSWDKDTYDQLGPDHHIEYLKKTWGENKLPFPRGKYTFYAPLKNNSVQKDGSSCGAWVVYFVDAKIRSILDNTPLDVAKFRNVDINEFRRNEIDRFASK